MGVIEAALEKLRRSGAVPETTSGQPSSVALDSWATDASAEAVSSGRQIALDRLRLRAAGYLPEVQEEQRFADHYREIKRPIIRRALAANAPPSERLILVTSSLPAEGKTFTALNLALSMARERDLSVLLIDGDFPKAHISRALDINEEPGLLDAVADKARDVESLVLRTDVKGLDILTGGSSPSGAVELVASARMSEVVGRLLARSPRRMVIIDSSPLLVSSEARALIQLASQIILVARSGLTPRRALQDSIAQIDEKKLQGLVLNNAYAKTQNQYYGYPKYGKTETGGDHV